MTREDDLLLLSGLQHFVYCPRQWALIHIEQQWQENWHTADGHVIHERAHDAAAREHRGDLLICRGLPLRSPTLGICGVCDVVEFRRGEHGVPLAGEDGLWQPTPIEYKRGQPKEHEADELQLTAQAMCLEEMLCCSIPVGYLYYNEPHRRTKVELDQERRQRVGDLLAEMRDLYHRGHTPRCKQHPGCKSCSLQEICLPRLSKTVAASAYIRAALAEKEV